MAKQQEILYGINTIYEVLKLQQNTFYEICIVDNKSHNKDINNIINLAKQHNIAIKSLDKKSFIQKFPDSGTNSIAAIFQPKAILDETALKHNLKNQTAKHQRKWCFLILDNIQDTNNLGACLRTAEAAGVDGVIITKDNSAGITPAVRKVAMGATENLNIYSITNLVRTLDILKEHNVWIVGTTLDTDNSLYSLDLNLSLALIIGNEATGMRNLTTKNCDFLLKIPMQGTMQSLNASVTTGICLFEINRQRSSV